MEIKPGIKLVSESVGSGQAVKKGDTVTVRLNGWLNQGDPIQENNVKDIVVGGRLVIPGIEYSLEGMKQGGKRKIKISPHLGYKEAGIKNLIPANAVLIYEIEVLDVKTL
ncbi:MAG: FKBP-type peptidyl-prolyl cis-trans isomerase [Nitrospirota bacterium]|nr:FKBP-type peptidyl-prolyl cis-trans isomerase [Nitrospirota bacterium]MDH4361490.1 FKBP-type peptidyl-prolyl cis-trans isomerase [Nitrospirota bacterium]MDH5575273.1 FKBP-type peptidyl-prolyl cis-trans isomerase [Nitrospirota bacterium]